MSQLTFNFDVTIAPIEELRKRLKVDACAVVDRAFTDIFCDIQGQAADVEWENVLYNYAIQQLTEIVAESGERKVSAEQGPCHSTPFDEFDDEAEWERLFASVDPKNDLCLDPLPIITAEDIAREEREEEEAAQAVRRHNGEYDIYTGEPLDDFDERFDEPRTPIDLSPKPVLWVPTPKPIPVPPALPAGRPKLKPFSGPRPPMNFDEP